MSITRTATIALAAWLAARPSSAATFEAGLQVGAVGRQLSETPHATVFNAQMYGEVALFRDRLGVGVYVNGWPAGASSAPEKVGAETVDLRAYGVRSRAMLPLTKVFALYAHVGLGYVEGEFPEVIYRPCDGCARRSVPSAKRTFVEVPFGVGVRARLDGPFVATVEGAYRPMLGYKHAQYDAALGGGGEGSSAHAWTFLLGLGFVL